MTDTKNTKNTEMVKTLLNELSDCRQEYLSAVSRNSGVSVAKTTLMNTLFSRLGDILTFLKYVIEENSSDSEKVASLQDEINGLKRALEEADAEYAEINKKYKALADKKKKPVAVAMNTPGGG